MSSNAGLSNDGENRTPRPPVARNTSNRLAGHRPARAFPRGRTARYWSTLAVAAGLVVGSGASAGAAEALPNSHCLDCHNDQELYKTNRAGVGISLFLDEAEFGHSIHGTNTCVSCHEDLTSEHPDNEVAAQPVACARCHAHQSETYQGSAHATALTAGIEGAATCADCHGTHAILPPTSPASQLHFTKLASTCGDCHPAIADEVAESVHGKAIAKGRRDAATCTDCHSEHRIEDLRTLSPIQLAQEVCSKCHASERLNTKYRLPPDRVRTFMESYHGLASQYGSTHVANCASCHGVHLILAATDPRSTIHADNLVQTCGKCHPGATENFAAGKIHVDAANGADIASRITYWVRRVYLGLIFVIIGAMLVHNFLLWRLKVRAAWRAKGHLVQRMTRSQRIQHMVLALSFIVLAVTGFALTYPDSWLAGLLGANEAMRRLGHRIAAAIMLGLGAYHLVYVLATREGRQMVKDFLPQRKDVRDVALQARHLTGHTKSKPRFGRFSYAEKLEYWAVVWGTIIMGVTGVMIWFKIDVTQFLPRWAVDAATAVHYYEAILACLAILVWHFYHVIFDPDVYPMNGAWWDGQVSAAWYRHEHPLDKQALKNVPPEPVHSPASGHQPAPRAPLLPGSELYQGEQPQNP